MDDHDQLLREVLETFAKRERGPCPEVETLVAFVDGELGDDEAEQLREHLAVCRVCMGDVLGMMRPAEVTAEELDEGWRELRGRLVEAGVLT